MFGKFLECGNKVADRFSRVSTSVKVIFLFLRLRQGTIDWERRWSSDVGGHTNDWQGSIKERKIKRNVCLQYSNQIVSRLTFFTTLERLLFFLVFLPPMSRTSHSRVTLQNHHWTKRNTKPEPCVCRAFGFMIAIYVDLHTSPTSIIVRPQCHKIITQNKKQKKRPSVIHWSIALWWGDFECARQG